MYGPPETEADFAFACRAGSGSISIIANAPRRLSRIELKAGEWVARLPASSEYDGEVFEGYTVSAKLPADHGLLSELISGRDFKTSTSSSSMPARSAVERSTIATFVEACRKQSS